MLDQIIKIAEKAIALVTCSDIEAAVIWGSVANQKKMVLPPSDIDILVIKKDLLDMLDCETIFGIPAKIINYSGYKLDIFFVDLPYIEQAIYQKHWTVINAIKNGIVIKNNGILDDLREKCSDFRAFSLTTSFEWLNQARNLFKKAQDVLEKGDYLSSIVLSRHAADAMVYALIYKKLGEPPSPKSYMFDLKNRLHQNDIYDLYLEIQNLSNQTKIEAMRYNLLTMDLMQRIDAEVVKEGPENEDGDTTFNITTQRIG